MTPNLVSEGDISPCRFVKMGSASNKGAQATAGSPCVGVTQNFTRSVSLGGYITLTETLIAKAGDAIPMWGFGSAALLQLGGTVAAGDRLKSDANGKGVTAAAADGAYAIALQSGVADNFITVQIIYDTVGAA